MVDDLESSPRKRPFLGASSTLDAPTLPGPRFTQHEITRFEALLRPLIVNPKIPLATSTLTTTSNYGGSGGNGVFKPDNQLSCATKPTTISRSVYGRPAAASLRSRDYILKDWNWNDGICTCDLCRAPTSTCASCRKNTISNGHQPKLIKGCDCNLCQSREGTTTTRSIGSSVPLFLKYNTNETAPPVASITASSNTVTTKNNNSGNQLIFQTLQNLGNTDTKVPSSSSLPPTPVPITSRLARGSEPLPQKTLKGPSDFSSITSSSSSSSSSSSPSSSFSASSFSSLTPSISPKSEEKPLFSFGQQESAKAPVPLFPFPAAPQADAFVAPKTISAPEAPLFGTTHSTSFFPPPAAAAAESGNQSTTGKRRKGTELDGPAAKAPSFSFGTSSEPSTFNFDFTAGKTATNPTSFSSFTTSSNTTTSNSFTNAFSNPSFSTPAFDPTTFNAFSGSFPSASFPTLSAPTNFESTKSGKAAKARKYSSRNNLEAGLKLYEDVEEIAEEAEEEEYGEE